MAWTYEIKDGVPLNDCWKAFCELAQGLRARIIATDGDDTNAPVYDLPDGSTAKAVTIADFAGSRLHSELLKDNADILRDAIMEKNTQYNSIWCNAGGTLRYVTAQDVIEDISVDSDWILLADYMTAEFWTQIQDVMAAIRYILYYPQPTSYSGTYSRTLADGDSGSAASLASAWTALAADYAETPGTPTSDNNSGAVSVFVNLTYSTGPIIYRLTLSGATVESESPDMQDLYTSLAGTITDSGYSVIFAAAEIGHPTLGTPTLNGPITYENDVFNYDVTGPLSNHYEYGNLAGAEIDFGTITLTPAPPTATEFAFYEPPSVGVTQTLSVDVRIAKTLVAAVTGNVIDKNKITYYITDLSSVLSYI